MITNQKIAYYKGSEVRIINSKNPHYLAIGRVIGGEDTPLGPALKIRRFDKQQDFFIHDENDFRITKR